MQMSRFIIRNASYGKIKLTDMDETISCRDRLIDMLSRRIADDFKLMLQSNFFGNRTDAIKSIADNVYDFRSAVVAIVLYRGELNGDFGIYIPSAHFSDNMAKIMQSIADSDRVSMVINDVPDTNTKLIVFSGNQRAFSALWWSILVARGWNIIDNCDNIKQFIKISKNSTAVWSFPKRDPATHHTLLENYDTCPQVWRWLLNRSGPISINKEFSDNLISGIEESLKPFLGDDQLGRSFKGVQP